jgi:hypothetical protein
MPSEDIRNERYRVFAGHDLDPIRVLDEPIRLKVARIQKCSPDSLREDVAAATHVPTDHRPERAGVARIAFE